MKIIFPSKLAFIASALLVLCASPLAADSAPSTATPVDTKACFGGVSWHMPIPEGYHIDSKSSGILRKSANQYILSDERTEGNMILLVNEWMKDPSSWTKYETEGGDLVIVQPVPMTVGGTKGMYSVIQVGTEEVYSLRLLYTAKDSHGAEYPVALFISAGNDALPINDKIDYFNKIIQTIDTAGPCK